MTMVAALEQPSRILSLFVFVLKFYSRRNQNYTLNIYVQNSDFLDISQEAVRILNSLISPKGKLNATATDESLPQESPVQMEVSSSNQDTNKRVYKVPNMFKFAERAGLSLHDIEKLKVIHISGTKGKGSTCAFCESILRKHGLKTGLFSSPHLIRARERIKLNGRAIEMDHFTKCFWKIYTALTENKEEEGDKMPRYFAFLLLMALMIFIEERVDVAIIEVGIGGEYDRTNFIRRPVVCGVTSLGLDHTGMLGKTIQDIAWNKAGIFKRDVPAVTSPQPEEAMSVLKKRADEIGGILKVAKSLESFEKSENGGNTIVLGIPGPAQRLNAALAVEIAQIFLSTVKTNICGAKGSIADPRANPIKPMIEGLKNCKLAGRAQTIQRQRLTYFLDGAHTPESIKYCVEWFMKESKKEIQQLRTVKILLFNATGDRDISGFLDQLQRCNFDRAAFCPNIADENTIIPDSLSFRETKEEQLERVEKNVALWKEKYQQRRSAFPERTNVDDIENDVKSFTTIKTALSWASQGREPSVKDVSLEQNPRTKGPLVENESNDHHIQILVTGSLRLVGDLLGVLGEEVE